MAWKTCTKQKQTYPSLSWNFSGLVRSCWVWTTGALIIELTQSWNLDWAWQLNQLTHHERELDTSLSKLVYNSLTWTLNMLMFSITLIFPILQPSSRLWEWIFRPVPGTWEPWGAWCWLKSGNWVEWLAWSVCCRQQGYCSRNYCRFWRSYSGNSQSRQ